MRGLYQSSWGRRNSLVIALGVGIAAAFVLPAFGHDGGHSAARSNVAVRGLDRPPAPDLDPQPRRRPDASRRIDPSRLRFGPGRPIEASR